jgi:hypothetical protein
MKNLFSFAAIAALTIFAASCGNDEAEKKRKEDSAHLADSLALVHSAWVADSAHDADSVRMANEALEATRIADSTRRADSIANLKKPGTKPKTTTTVPKTEPKVGGKR